LYALQVGIYDRLKYNCLLNIGPDYNIFPNIIPILSKFQLQRLYYRQKKILL